MQSDQDKRDAQSDEWGPCAQGELGRLANRLKANQVRASRKRMYKATLVSTALFAGVILVVGSFWGRVGFQYGGISCKECYSHFAEYRDHLTEVKLLADANLAESMKTHLDKCWLCNNKFNKEYPGVLSARALAPKAPLLVALQPQFAIPSHQSLY